MGNKLKQSKNDFQDIAGLSLEEAQNRGYKEKDFDETKVLIYKLYISATYDFNQIINILCPYCFYSEKGDICLYQFYDDLGKNVKSKIVVKKNNILKKWLMK